MFFACATWSGTNTFMSFYLHDVQYLRGKLHVILIINNSNSKHLCSTCSTECAHRRFTVNYYYYPWSIGLETIIYHHSLSVEHTSPAVYMALVELFNYTISFTARPGSTHRLSGFPTATRNSSQLGLNPSSSRDSQAFCRWTTVRPLWALCALCCVPVACPWFMGFFKTTNVSWLGAHCFIFKGFQDCFLDKFNSYWFIVCHLKHRACTGTGWVQSGLYGVSW